MSIDLNFEKIYMLTPDSDNLDKFTFHSPLANGGSQLIKVEVEKTGNSFIPEFMSLGFGPPKKDGTIDDMAAVAHLDYSKAFSTILFCGLLFLRAHPDFFVGIDGSDFRRAYLYFRTLQRNHDYLNEYFRIQGIKYYARVLRGKDKYDQLPIDPKELMHIAMNIDKAPLTNHKSLFNYFLFSLNL